MSQESRNHVKEWLFLSTVFAKFARWVQFIPLMYDWNDVLQMFFSENSEQIKLIEQVNEIVSHVYVFVDTYLRKRPINDVWYVLFVDDALFDCICDRTDRRVENIIFDKRFVSDVVGAVNRWNDEWEDRFALRNLRCEENRSKITECDEYRLSEKVIDDFVSECDLFVNDLLEDEKTRIDAVLRCFFVSEFAHFLNELQQIAHERRWAHAYVLCDEVEERENVFCSEQRDDRREWVRHWADRCVSEALQQWERAREEGVRVLCVALQLVYLCEREHRREAELCVLVGRWQFFENRLKLENLIENAWTHFDERRVEELRSLDEVAVDVWRIQCVEEGGREVADALCALFALHEAFEKKNADAWVAQIFFVETWCAHVDESAEVVFGEMRQECEWGRQTCVILVLASVENAVFDVTYFVEDVVVLCDDESDEFVHRSESRWLKTLVFSFDFVENEWNDVRAVKCKWRIEIRICDEDATAYVNVIVFFAL